MKRHAMGLALAASIAPCASLSVFPPRIELYGAGAAQTYVVTESGDDGYERDVTSRCVAKAAGVASVTGGEVRALANGSTTLQVRCGNLTARVPVVVKNAGKRPGLSFVNDVVPIFTMGGCAGSNCHGSIRGQRGFKLSLFGYEPALDYEALKGGDQHRLNLAEPEKSLILRKPTMQEPHGGGFRFGMDSIEYRTILEWLRQGAPYDSGDTPRLAGLTVFPPERVLVGVEAAQQLVALARYSDGTVRDVTRLVQYSSNEPDTVQVTGSGKAKALQAGETAVMVRMLGKAVAARILVAASATAKDYPDAARNNLIDEHVFAKLKKLNIRPSAAAADEQFLRRVYLDTIGLLPTEAEAHAFLDSQDPDKRPRLIDRLLERREFSEVWALKFTELFRAGTREAGNKGGKIIYDWVRRAFQDRMPYDEFVRRLVLSQGAHLYGKEPSSFYNISFDSNAPDHAVNVSQLFLGMRIECAKCHNHPWEKWTQDDFWGFAAVFARVGIKEVYENDENATVYMEEGTVAYPKTKQPVAPRFLDGPAIEDGQDLDIREQLAAWMAEPANPFFARAIVNRVWKHFMGRGLVEEVDDFRVTNPPTHPELLDALARGLAAHKFDLRRTMRLILNSKAYQLSAEPNESNRSDTRNYSRFAMRRLMAEVIVDAIGQVTGVRERFRGYPPETRAMQVYGGGSGYMLPAFGRLNRDIICERDHQPDMAQTMHLVSGETVNRKISAKDSALEAWLKDASMTDEGILERIYLTSLVRAPSPAERRAVLDRIGGGAGARREVFQDLLWAILNSKEFLYNH